MTEEATKEEDGSGGKMPLLDHLIELRSRLLKSVLAIGLAFGVCFYYAKRYSASLYNHWSMRGRGH